METKRKQFISSGQKSLCLLLVLNLRYPGGKRTERYQDAIVEKFAPYVHQEGVVLFVKRSFGKKKEERNSLETEDTLLGETAASGKTRCNSNKKKRNLQRLHLAFRRLCIL